MLEHCIAAFEREKEEKEYRAYVTDSLMYLLENTSTYILPGVGEIAQGMRMKGRWLDAPSKPEPERQEDTRTAEEIAGGIWQRIRG